MTPRSAAERGPRTASGRALMRPEYLHFVRWVNHDSDCMGRFGDPQPCTCGLREAIRSFEAEAATAAVPLDVERLTEALHEAHWWSRNHSANSLATDLAVEYARLSADEEDPDPTGILDSEPGSF